MLSRDSRLRVFHFVALHGSFTKAADALGLTQQAVSFQVKALEEEVGTKLFLRTPTGAGLTCSGKDLYGHSTKIFALYAEAEEAMASYAENAARKVSLGATGSIARHCLPRVIEAFRRERPHVHLHVRIGSSHQVLEWLSEEAADIGIVSAGPIALDRFRVERWFRDELVLIAPPRHRWVAAADFRVEDLQHEPFVIREEGSGSRTLIEGFLRDHGISVGSMNVVLEVQSTDAVKAAVEAGVGVAIVSALSLRDDPRSARCVPVRHGAEHWERDFYVVTAHRRFHNAPTCEFLNLLQASVPA